MKQLNSIILILLTMTMCKSMPEGQKILMETSLGDIKILLYDETPLHRDNFIKLCNEEYYEDLTFHRVIKGFMIQAGDAKTASDSIDRQFDHENVIAPEFLPSKYFHKTGALAAARWGDEENPGKLSDASQFYIVSGKNIYEHDLKMVEKERFEKLKQKIYQEKQKSSLDSIKAMYKESDKAGIATLRANILEQSEKEAEERKEEILFSEKQKKTYTEVGGTPHLDGEYTVFGEVYEGLDVVKQIEKVETNMNDKPLKAVVIKSIKLIK